MLFNHIPTSLTNMAPAPNLPLEVLDIILSYIEEDYDDPLWHSLSLINHSWHVAVTPRIYSRFEYHGDFEKRGALWLFLRTVIEAPWLASLVQTVDLQHALKFTGAKSFSLAELLCTRHETVVRQAIKKTNISSLGSDVVLKALRKDDRRPLVAMILASLPNLETLSMNVSDSDPYLQPILQRAIGIQHHGSCELSTQTPVFQHLRRLSIAPEDHEQKREPLNINMLQPFVYLPELLRLNIISASIDPDLFTRTEKPVISRKLSELTIVIHEDSPLEGLWLLLQSIPSLTSLSLCFKGIPATSWEPRGRKTLWDQLERFQRTLQHLDISGIIIEQTRPQPGTAEYCVPLRKFTQLETLSIEPNILVGNCIQCNPPMQLAHHLPRGLKQLTLYDGSTFRIHQGQFYIPQLERQMENIARMSEPPAQITMEQRWNTSGLQGLETACCELSIPYQRRRHEQLEQGGRLSSFARSSQRHQRPHQPEMAGVLRQLVRSRPAMSAREAEQEASERKLST